MIEAWVEGKFIWKCLWKDKYPPWPTHLSPTSSLWHIRISLVVGVLPLNYLFQELWFPGALSYLICGKQENSIVISMNRTWLNSHQEIRTKGNALPSKGWQSVRKGQNGVGCPKWKEGFTSPQGGKLSSFSSLGFSSIRQQSQPAALHGNTSWAHLVTPVVFSAAIWILKSN